MRNFRRPGITFRGTAAAGLLFGLLSFCVASADDKKADPQATRPSVSSTLDATRGVKEPLNLLLTQAELRSIVRAYEDRTGEILTAPFIDEDAIIVTAPGERVPMRNPSQDVMGGIAAPFWAIAHPKDAWRIFVPIPPRGTQQDERPAPDPR